MANEVRLIDANALLAEAEKAKIRFPHDRAIMFDLIKNAPTVDAVPVVHGQWEFYCKDYSKCSQFGFGRNIKNQFGWHYCPNCGAPTNDGYKRMCGRHFRELERKDNERKTD